MAPQETTSIEEAFLATVPDPITDPAGFRAHVETAVSNDVARQQYLRHYLDTSLEYRFFEEELRSNAGPIKIEARVEKGKKIFKVGDQECSFEKPSKDVTKLTFELKYVTDAQLEGRPDVQHSFIFLYEKAFLTFYRFSKLHFEEHGRDFPGDIIAFITNEVDRFLYSEGEKNSINQRSVNLSAEIAKDGILVSVRNNIAKAKSSAHDLFARQENMMYPAFNSRKSPSVQVGYVTMYTDSQAEMYIPTNKYIISVPIEADGKRTIENIVVEGGTDIILHEAREGFRDAIGNYKARELKSYRNIAKNLEIPELFFEQLTQEVRDTLENQGRKDLMHVANGFQDIHSSIRLLMYQASLSSINLARDALDMRAAINADLSYVREGLKILGPRMDAATRSAFK